MLYTWKRTCCNIEITTVSMCLVLLFSTHFRETALRFFAGKCTLLALYPVVGDN
jgi:hypothetical protein